MEAPDYTRPVIGFRYWRPKEGRLYNLTMSPYYPWEPGVNEARCYRTYREWFYEQCEVLTRIHDPELKQAHRSKLKVKTTEVVERDHQLSECECGLYSLTYEASRKYLMSMNRTNLRGAVALWGELAVYKDGYRAEYARIVALEYNPYLPLDPQREIARYYGVKLVADINVREEAYQFGSPLELSLDAVCEG